MGQTTTGLDLSGVQTFFTNPITIMGYTMPLWAALGIGIVGVSLVGSLLRK